MKKGDSKFLALIAAEVNQISVCLEGITSALEYLTLEVKKLNVILWKIKDRIKDAIEYEWAICGLTGGKWFSFMRLKKGELFKLNPWIEYVSTHTTLSYAATINLYDKCSSLPIKLTRRRARGLTTLIIEQSRVGIAGLGLDPGMMAATVEAKEE